MMGGAISGETGVHAALALAETVLVVSGLRFHPDATTDGEIVIVLFEGGEAAAGVEAGDIEAIGGCSDGFVVEVGLCRYCQMRLRIVTVIPTRVKAVSCVVNSLSGMSFCSSTSSVSVMN